MLALHLSSLLPFTLDGKFIDSASVENKVYYREGSKSEQNLNETWEKVIESLGPSSSKNS
jgi:sugar (pentulose or hexulose) kinase